MTIKVRKGGAWQTITAAKIYANGAWRTLVSIKVYKSGAWRTVGNFTAPAEPPPTGGGGTGGGGTGGGGGGGTLTVTATPASLSADDSVDVITTDPATATPSGGLAPYTYVWTPTGAIADSPSLATTTFHKTLIVPGHSSGSATCTVTDSLGTTATSNTVTLTFTRT